MKQMFQLVGYYEVCCWDGFLFFFFFYVRKFMKLDGEFER